MAQLSARRRASLPKTAFAYVDSKGRRRLPIHDEAHVRNALARFNQVAFEDEMARERARKRLLSAAKRYGIVPIGFMNGELRTQMNEAAAGRLVVKIEQAGEPGALQEQLRSALRDPTLEVLHWSDASGSYLDGTGRPSALPGDGEARSVTLLERSGSRGPLAALVHDPSVLDAPQLLRSVTGAVRLAIEKARLEGQVEARASDIRQLPNGLVTFLFTDIQDSTGLLSRIGEGYGAVLNDTRAIQRAALRRTGGREVDARADEFFAAFEDSASALRAAVMIQRAFSGRAWPQDDAVNLRIGIHRGRPTLTETGYVGLAVHTVARICGAAAGGQILMSAAAHDGLTGTEAGVELRSLGVYRLHGLAEPMPLFQVLDGAPAG